MELRNQSCLDGRPAIVRPSVLRGKEFSIGHNSIVSNQIHPYLRWMVKGNIDFIPFFTTLVGGHKDSVIMYGK